MIKETFSSMHISHEHHHTSVLRRILETAGLERFLYAILLIGGVVFYGFGFVTAYGVLLHFINEGVAIAPATWTFIAYAIMNFMIGYGFIYHRKWLLSAFTGALALIVARCVYFFSVDSLERAKVLYSTIAILAGISIFLCFARRVLSGRYGEWKVLLVFFFALLFSFWITYRG